MSNTVTSKHQGVCHTDEDWYLGYHPAWTQNDQGGVCYYSARHPKDFRGP
jgi:hypothetical protein